MARVLPGFGIPISRSARSSPQSVWGGNLVSAITVQLLLLLCCISVLVSQEDRIEFEHLSIEQGLSQSDVCCILQDGKGFVWFGTQDGLNMYDGYGFRVYRHDASNSESISDNYITAMAQDRFGNIWIGTQNGLNLFDQNTQRFYHCEPDSRFRNKFGSNAITSLCEDPSGALLVGTYGAGLMRIETARDRVSFLMEKIALSDSSNSEAIASICKDRDGAYWVGTLGQGLYKLGPACNVVGRFRTTPGDSNSLGQDNVRCVYEDRHRILWVGTSDGLNRLELGSHKFKHYAMGENPRNVYSNYIFCIHEDELNRLWIGTDGGLELYERESDSFRHYGAKAEDLSTLSDDAIMSIGDAGGVVWFGSRKGLNKFCRFRKQFRTYKYIPHQGNSLSEGKVWSIYCDGGGILWVGSNGGLDRIDRRSNKYLHYRHNPSDSGSLSNNSVMSILEDESGGMWIGTWGGGLERFDKRSESFEHYPRLVSDSSYLASNTIVSMSEDERRRLWMGTYGGVAVFDLREREYRREDEESANSPLRSLGPVEMIRHGNDHKLWFGTWHGLIKYDSEKKASASYLQMPRDSTRSSHDRVLSILPARDGTLFVGTPTGLKSMTTMTGEFTQYATRDGLPNDVICGILEDKQGNLWISTNKGISKFAPAANRIRNYDVGDGLQSNEFDQWAFFKSESGEMFFGGINGVTSFFPDSLHDNPHIPPIVLTSFKIGDREKNLVEACSDSNPVQLSYKDNGFSFELAALDYTRPEKNQYAYMLEGFDADWIYSGARRYASYTNLDPGHYILHLKGSNNDGVWNEHGISLRLWIAPPFWMTWWFRGTVILFLLSSATISYVSRTRAINKRNRILERRITEATAELNSTNESLQTEVLERKRSEDELWRYKHQLEEQVLERTAQLSQTVLSLEEQIAARVLAEQSLVAYQEKLRALAFDLSATEERERRRLSMYLHDSIGQTLAFCKIKLQSVQRSSRRAGSDTRLREIQDMVEKSIVDTRKLTLELSPPILHELGLVPAIEWLCKRYQGEHQIHFSVNADPQPLSLNQDLSNLLFHATREVIVNIIKHAGAKNAEISVHQDRDRICVEIADDGCGFDAQSMQDNVKQRDAFGLFSVRERLHSLGGRMEIVSKRGSGTNVKLTLQNLTMDVGARGT